MPSQSTFRFGELNLSAPVLRSLVEMGFEELTPVQTRAVPLLLEGRDMVAQATDRYGQDSGVGIPLVERVDTRRRVPQAVVLAPTRELVVQVAEQLRQLGHHRGLLLLPIYGGQRSNASSGFSTMASTPSSPRLAGW